MERQMLNDFVFIVCNIPKSIKFQLHVEQSREETFVYSTILQNSKVTKELLSILDSPENYFHRHLFLNKKIDLIHLVFPPCLKIINLFALTHCFCFHTVTDFYTVPNQRSRLLLWNEYRKFEQKRRWIKYFWNASRPSLFKNWTSSWNEKQLARLSWFISGGHTPPQHSQ